MESLPVKGPEEVLDYDVRFNNLLADGLELDSHAVSIVSADPPESPLTLIQSNSSIVSSGETSPNRADTVRFWLAGGTPGTKYILEVTGTDTQNAPLDRKFERHVSVKVKDLQ